MGLNSDFFSLTIITFFTLIIKNYKSLNIILSVASSLFISLFLSEVIVEHFFYLGLPLFHV